MLSSQFGIKVKVDGLKIEKKDRCRGILEESNKELGLFCGDIDKWLSPNLTHILGFALTSLYMVGFCCHTQPEERNTNI